MAPKFRPPPLEEAQKPSSSVTVTDTMTLVVQDDATGNAMRVKDGVMVARTSDTTPLDSAGGGESRSVLNRISYEELRIGDVLGRGSQGKVRLVQHKGSLELYAMKYLDFEGSEEAQATLAAELRQVNALKHDNIVSSFEAFFRKSRLCIVLEYMDAGSVADVIKRTETTEGGLPDAVIAFLAKGLLLGLAHIHRQKVMHRDIKPANVLATSRGDVKIADFGISKAFSGVHSQTVSIKGSTPYMSPEMITAQPYSYASDIWSAGLTVAECAIGSYPFVFKKNGVFEHYDVVVDGIKSVRWDQKGRTVSDTVKSFVELCLRPAKERPSAEELLKHPLIELASTITKEEAGKWFGKK